MLLSGCVQRDCIVAIALLSTALFSNTTFSNTVTSLVRNRTSSFIVLRDIVKLAYSTFRQTDIYIYSEKMK